MIEYSPRNINERIDLIIYRFIYKGIYPRVLIEIKETSNNYLAPSKIKEIESDCEKLDRVRNKIIELSNEGIYPRSVGNSIRLPWLYFFSGAPYRASEMKKFLKCLKGSAKNGLKWADL